MVSFSVCVILLIVGYFVYGRVVDRVFGVDPERLTPAYEKADGVDFVALPGWRVFMIQFLNIAGLGPVFGAILGAKFGAMAYIWIVIGCIFAGAVHDYFTGMISVRNGGISYPEIVGRYMGNSCMQVTRVLTPLMLVLVGTVFASGAAGLLTNLSGDFLGTSGITVFKLTGESMSPVFVFWSLLIFAYFIMATVLPVNKVIGRFYPIFGVALLFMAVGILCCLFYYMPSIPEITDGLGNTHPGAETMPLFPMLFITLACGALSGFHGTQSPMMARCLKNERQGRAVFYGAMISEGVVAMIWAAAASYAFHTPDGKAFLEATNAAVVVDFIAKHWMGTIGGALAVLGVVAAPVTSGDTAFRAARMMVADAMGMDQKPLKKRVLLSLPLFALGFLLMFVDFSVIWRYFAWFNQILGTMALWMVAIYLVREEKNYWIGLVPAVFMMAVVCAYVFVSPEMLGLNMWIGNAFGVVVAVLSVLCFYIWKKRLALDTPKDLKLKILQRMEAERQAAAAVITEKE